MLCRPRGSGGGGGKILISPAPFNRYLKLQFSRSSGVILHPTSLPGPYGIGDLGSSAYAFADFLKASGQHIWQILPLVPTGYGDSPYSGLSAHAGNTLMISPEKLMADNLLPKDILEHTTRFTADKVNFGKVIEFKKKILKEAFQRYKKSPDTKLQTEFLSFCQKHAHWLEDYALFVALKDSHDGKAWDEWEPRYAKCKEEALEKARDELSDEILAEQFYQFLFFKQWHELKRYCNARKISIIGDMPILVAYDSVDVWKNNHLFKLDKDGKPTVVAGVPPDYFSATGQLWGNPLYDWEEMAKDNFRWWIKRFESMLENVDVIRIDHFRGFAGLWEIPAGQKTAEKGKWVSTPGDELFKALVETFDDLPIIVEDLGVITPDVEELRDKYHFPGMRILQMAFGGDSCNIDLPHNYIRHSVVYTGGHDHDTVVGWFRSKEGAGSTRGAEQIKEERQKCLRYLRSTGKEIHWDFIEAAYASVSCLAIVPLQDVLGLGSSARMNLPASMEGNWNWRYRQELLNDETTKRLAEITALYGRDNPLFEENL